MLITLDAALKDYRPLDTLTSASQPQAEDIEEL